MSLMAGALAVTTPVNAAPTSQSTVPNVKLSARSLFQGWFKYGDWLPIEVNLENFGEAVSVKVEASITTRNSGANFTTNYQREVNLGERANKRFLIYVIPYVETTNPSRSITYDTSVELWAGDRKLSEEKVNLLPVSPNDYLVGTVTQDGNTLSNALSNLKIGGQRTRVGSVSLGLNDIPDQGNGLRSFNSLIFGEVNTDSLTADQRTAIQEWVEAGGQLILLGGNGWSKVRSAFSNALLPLDVSNYSNVLSMDGLVSPNGEDIKSNSPLTRPAVIARSQVLQGAHLLSYLPDGNNYLPVVAERQMGEGRVLAVSLDLAASPLLEWSGTNQLWQEMFGFNITPFNSLYTDNNPQIKNAQDMLGFVSSVPELRLPDILPFLGLLGLYLLLIVPVNFAILKKIGRLELAWFTLPVFGAIFVVISLNYANSQPPGDVLISQLTVVQSGQDQDIAQVRSYAAVFSPVDRTYDIGLASSANGDNSPLRGLATPLNRTSVSATATDPERTVTEGDNLQLTDFQIGQWSAQGFSVETTLPAKSFQLVGDLHYEGDKIVGSVRNNTGSAIRNSLLVLGDQMFKFKDVIEAGEVANVDFALPAPTAAVMAYCTSNFNSSSSFSNTNPSEKLANLLLQDHRDDKLTQARAGFLRKLYESGRYSPLNNQRGLDLIGWIDQNPLPLAVGGVTSQSKSSQVLISRLPVDLETKSGDGRFMVPAMGFFPETATANNGSSPYTSRTDRTDELCLNKGSVTVQYLLPIEHANYKVSKLTLYLNSFSVTGRREPTLPDSVELYDYQSQSWQPWNNLQNSAVQTTVGSNFTNPPPTAIKNVMEDAERFSDPKTGRILLRMNYNSSNATLLTQSGLEVEGTKK
jgi:hypothetical protein